MLKLITISLLALPVAFGQAPLTTAQIARRVSPSVVVIQGKTDSGDILGSGFIVSKDGKIVTNLHVIKDLKSASVQLANGEIFDSMSVLATDERRDLAVVHIGGFDLPVLDFANSNSVAVGESVVVVGSPRGLQGTVTAGILSSVRDSGDGFKVLQTDAAVNPGNSGGPLVNSKGQAIGVVSFKLRSSEGLNFAVPINYVSGMLSALHEPMSFDQMRTTLAGKPTVDQSSSGPSLKETLDWLKGKVPLSTYRYFSPISVFGPTDTTTRHVPVSFESCTVVLEDIGTMVTREAKPFTIIETTRYTIPLGELEPAEVFFYKDKSGGTLEGWVVSFQSKSKVILSEDHQDLGNRTKTESVDSAFLNFSDESTARRVQEAVNHAAQLCQGKEPF